jgi:L-2-hydroxyglutarate oxidase LhgO
VVAVGVVAVGVTFDIAIVGGGVIGLATAHQILKAQPGLQVAVLEKESAVATHASTRNSGVLHAGFYYSPDSMKASLTARGNALLREFCHDHGVPVLACGKVVLAIGDAEEVALTELHRRGIANGVDVRLVDRAELARLEPLAAPAELALWSPNTAVADPNLVAEALLAQVKARGVTVQTGAKVEAIDVRADGVGMRLAGGEVLRARHMINCVGLYADKLAHQFGVGLEYAVLPFRGLYVYGDWPKGRLQRHVYPVPDARNPFLGVHATVTASGGVKIGPTAIPAFWREHYRGLGGWSMSESAEVAQLLPKFFASDPKMTAGLLASEAPKVMKRSIVRAAKKLVPSINDADFKRWGPAGVRAQLIHRDTGKLEMDFIVVEGERSTHVLNAVSPAWTSSFAVGDYVAEKVLARL